MKRVSLWLLIFTMSTTATFAQLDKLTLEQAYAMLEDQYPILKNDELLERLYQKELESVDKARLPDIYVKGDSKLQSENISVSSEPGSPVPLDFSLPLFSAKAYVEIQYNILNGKINDTRQTLEGVALQQNLQELEVDKYALRDRINKLFVGITLLREQEKLLALSMDDLDAKLEVVNAGIDNGVSLPSEADRIRVRQLELQSQRSDLRARISGMIATLEELTGAELSDQVVLSFPELGDFQAVPDIRRPEQELFQLKREHMLARSAMIDLERRPYLGVFSQGGIGYPNPVNFFDTKFSPYGIIGVNFSWKITDWKKSAIDKELLTIRAQQLENAEEAFEFNLYTQEENYLAEVRRLEELARTDEQIAGLQADILGQMSAQLEEGVITSADYITQVNQELKARQNLAIHKVQLLQTQLEFWNARGGF